MPNQCRKVKQRHLKKPQWRPFHLRRLLSKSERIALVGIGSDLHGDDGVGVVVARRIQAIGRQTLTSVPHHSSCLRAFDGGTAPENLTGEIVRFLEEGQTSTSAPPRHLIIVDAADLGSAPGEVRSLPIHAADSALFGTHQLPLGVLADYLIQRTGCRVTVIAIQPRSVSFGSPLSPEVKQAVKDLVSEFRSIYEL